MGIGDILINNAGIVVCKYFHEHSTSEITKTMDINPIPPLVVTNEYLPLVLERNSGRICTIASSAARVSNPKMTVFAASKWATMGGGYSFRL